jgi:hypothetical protein
MGIKGKRPLPVQAMHSFQAILPQPRRCVRHASDPWGVGSRAAQTAAREHRARGAEAAWTQRSTPKITVENPHNLNTARGPTSDRAGGRGMATRVA